jgi:hypothetical protein
MKIRNIYKRLLGYKPFAFGYVKNYGERNEKVQKAELLCYSLDGFMDRERIYRHDFSPTGIDATINTLSEKLKNALPPITKKNSIFEGCKTPKQIAKRVVDNFPLCTEIAYPLEIDAGYFELIDVLLSRGFIRKTNTLNTFTFVGSCQK